jgi:vacuolar-type H+-ATPase subunit I/STV1
LRRVSRRGSFGLLKSTPMKRFYLALPTRYEDQVIETLGGLGTVQLITDYTINGFKKVDTVEKCEKYVKLQQRISSILSTLPPEKVTRKSLLHFLKKSAAKPIQKGSSSSPNASLEQIESRVLETETQLDSSVGKLEALRPNLKELKTLDETLLILKKHELRADALGGFENIFVKAGFINRAFSEKIEKYVEGTEVKFAKWPDKREEDFVFLLGLNRDKQYMEETLTRLNFAELTIPKGVPPDPGEALDQNRTSMVKLQREIDDAEKDVRNICEEFQRKGARFEPVVRRALAVEGARSAFGRTETLSLVHGWVPAEQEARLGKTVVASTNGAALLRFENPAPSDNPPVQINNRGVAGSFELFTRLRGTPEYNEIDPTLIVTVLFTIMYGMMFGDIGQGALLLVMGLIFNRLQRSFLGIPARAMKKLGGILATCGISAMFFGTLYGEFFLSEAFHPIFVNPIQGQTTMIIVALLFGVAQLSFGLVLKIVNLLRKKAMVEAAFGGVRLVYYVTGVVLAVKYVTAMSFAVFTENLGLLILAITCLIVVFLSPTIEGVLRHEFKLGEGVMKGVSEFIETFLSYLTNSISYVRLAAFAIAHSALGIAAAILGASMGALPGFIVMNLLAMTIEALGVFIQCMRLTYYEFFTKFYSGTGVPYRPFSLPKVFGTVK